MIAAWHCENRGAVEYARNLRLHEPRLGAGRLYAHVFHDMPWRLRPRAGRRADKSIGQAQFVLAIRRHEKDEAPTHVIALPGAIFLIAPEKRRGLQLVPMDYVGQSGRLTVDAPGYAEITRDVLSPLRPATADFGDITLGKQP